VDGDAAVREEGEEVCVAAQVVAEAVDEDELGFGGAIGLRRVLDGEIHNKVSCYDGKKVRDVELDGG
jgi:hypothetical protein